MKKEGFKISELDPIPSSWSEEQITNFLNNGLLAVASQELSKTYKVVLGFILNRIKHDTVSQDSLADVFDPSLNYIKDDPCVNDGIFYIAKKNISAGDFNPSDWKKINIVEYVDLIKAFLSSEHKTEKLYHKNDLCFNGSTLYKCVVNSTQGSFNINEWTEANIGEELTNLLNNQNKFIEITEETPYNDINELVEDDFIPYIKTDYGIAMYHNSINNSFVFLTSPNADGKLKKITISSSSVQEQTETINGVNVVIYGETTYSEITQMIGNGKPTLLYFKNSTSVPCMSSNWSSCYMHPSDTMIFMRDSGANYHFSGWKQFSHSADGGASFSFGMVVAQCSSSNQWSLFARIKINEGGLGLGKDAFDITVQPSRGNAVGLEINGYTSSDTKRTVLLPNTVTGSRSEGDDGFVYYFMGWSSTDNKAYSTAPIILESNEYRHNDIGYIVPIQTPKLRIVQERNLNDYNPNTNYPRMFSMSMNFATQVKHWEQGDPKYQLTFDYTNLYPLYDGYNHEKGYLCVAENKVWEKVSNTDNSGEFKPIINDDVIWKVVTIGELIKRARSLKDLGNLSDGAVVEIPNNSTGSLETEQSDLTIVITTDKIGENSYEAPNVALEIKSNQTCELTVLNQHKDMIGVYTELTPTQEGGNVIQSNTCELIAKGDSYSLDVLEEVNDNPFAIIAGEKIPVSKTLTYRAPTESKSHDFIMTAKNISITWDGLQIGFIPLSVSGESWDDDTPRAMYWLDDVAYADRGLYYNKAAVDYMISHADTLFGNGWKIPSFEPYRTLPNKLTYEILDKETGSVEALASIDGFTGYQDATNTSLASVKGTGRCNCLFGKYYDGAWHVMVDDPDGNNTCQYDGEIAYFASQPCSSNNQVAFGFKYYNDENVLKSALTSSTPSMAYPVRLIKEFKTNLNPMLLAPYTIQVRYKIGTQPTISKGIVTPISVSPVTAVYSVTYENNDWSSLFANETNLVEVYGANTEGVTNMSSMFENATSLESVRLFDTTKVFNMSRMFNECSSLKWIPLFDTSKIMNFDYMMNQCVNLEVGALILYKQVSSQINPPSYHLKAFCNCGSNTTSGSEELAQIPSNWK